MTYFYMPPQPLMNLVHWNLFFAGLDAVWIARLPVERYAGSRVTTVVMEEGP